MVDSIRARVNLAASFSQVAFDFAVTPALMRIGLARALALGAVGGLFSSGARGPTADQRGTAPRLSRRCVVQRARYSEPRGTYAGLIEGKGAADMDAEPSNDNNGSCVPGGMK